MFQKTISYLLVLTCLMCSIKWMNLHLAAVRPACIQHMYMKMTTANRTVHALIVNYESHTGRECGEQVMRPHSVHSNYRYDLLKLKLRAPIRDWLIAYYHKMIKQSITSAASTHTHTQQITLQTIEFVSFASSIRCTIDKWIVRILQKSANGKLFHYLRSHFPHASSLSVDFPSACDQSLIAHLQRILCIPRQIAQIKDRNKVRRRLQLQRALSAVHFYNISLWSAFDGHIECS